MRMLAALAVAAGVARVAVAVAALVAVTVRPRLSAAHRYETSAKREQRGAA